MKNISIKQGREIIRQSQHDIAMEMIIDKNKTIRNQGHEIMKQIINYEIYRKSKNE